MAPLRVASPRLLKCLWASAKWSATGGRRVRFLQTSASLRDEVQATPSTTASKSVDDGNDLLATSIPRLKRKLVRLGAQPVGPRRRRLALLQSPNIPFEQLPYQCFQEARKILMADREEKLKKIEVERERIARLREADPAVSGGEADKQTRQESMNKALEKLKIEADSNDPEVKRRFEDGHGQSRLVTITVTSTDSFRGHGQTHLQVPSKPTMEVLSPQDPGPKAHTTENCAGRST